MLAKESCIQFQKWDLINHLVKLQLTDHKLFCLVLNFQTSKVIVMFESVVSCHIKMSECGSFYRASSKRKLTSGDKEERFFFKITGRNKHRLLKRLDNKKEIPSLSSQLKTHQAYHMLANLLRAHQSDPQFKRVKV